MLLRWYWVHPLNIQPIDYVIKTSILTQSISYNLSFNPGIEQRFLHAGILPVTLVLNSGVISILEDLGS
jgi:hypothetical protein